MAKALVLSLPLHGHINPTVPLIRALAERGQDITYYARPKFAAAIEQAGARCRFYGGELLDFLRTLDLSSDVAEKIYFRNAQKLVPDVTPNPPPLRAL